MSNRYRDYQQFYREVLRGKAGPLASAAEEAADELYHQDLDGEFNAMWDDVDSDDE
jgi:hypothetical protein